MLIRRCFKVTIFIILVSVILAGTRIFYSYAAEPCQSVIEDISGDKYFPAVKEALKNAKSSIDMAMYFVNFSTQEKNSSVSQLVQELVNAHNRGVKVKVLLDQNIDFSSWDGLSREWKKEEKNDALFAFLKKQGIEVYFDNQYVVMHSKAIVIDEEKVILGSANWANSSLRKNWEISCLVKSKDFAKQILKDFNQITIDYEASILDEERRPPVRLSRDFLINPSSAPVFLAAHDEGALDLYLYLLKIFDGNPQAIVEINYKGIYDGLSMEKTSSFPAARVSLQKTLTRLERRNLISIIKRTPRSPLVILRDYRKNQPYAVPQGKYCSIPDEYWQYGWNKKLSFPEKYCYFINLDKGGAVRGRAWSAYRAGLIKEFNVTRDTIIRGMKGLRKLNIIEVDYPDYSDDYPFQEKEPTQFTLLGLYSPEILAKEKERLPDFYGKELFQQAVKYAEIVYKENDIQVIEDIIKKIEEYGIEEVDKAFRIVSDKSYSNPKRSYKYVVGMLQIEAREADGFRSISDR